MKKLALAFLVLLTVSCSSNDDIDTRVEKHFVEVKNKCDSNEYSKYEITKEYKEKIYSQVVSDPNRCKWVSFITVYSKRKSGYFVSLETTKEDQE
ncbi:hypothetical protein [Tenacibaculum mesophilum]|uniref:hypothetical protein n=1 Tax=Tenacibaculum mesophilum TaxID=104268 RepID=UPI0024901FB7|nr:hypothetical protein [Tenacibaculum mesophilum]